MASEVQSIKLTNAQPKDTICKKCQKKEHFQHMCRSKSVAVVSVESTGYEFPGTITSSQVDTIAMDGSSSNKQPTNGI